MALPSSGSLTLAQIQTEFGGSNPISLSEYYRGGAYVTSNNTSVPTSGAISLSNFYGAVRQFAFTISSNQTNANLRTLAVSAGWDQAAPVVATINSGIYISSDSTATPALTVSGSFPGGVALVNGGFIVGRGGNGGIGAGCSGRTLIAGTAGTAGGLALSVSSGISITNNGTIGGGGGGGGGGDGGWWNELSEGASDVQIGGGGGGGGRSSVAANSTGGAGGAASGGDGFNYPGAAGTGGTYTAAGSGGAGGNSPTIYDGGAGGAGGTWGSSGATGLYGPYALNEDIGPYSGGAGGGSVSGNSNITWVATGTRLGAIT